MQLKPFDSVPWPLYAVARLASPVDLADVGVSPRITRDEMKVLKRSAVMSVRKLVSKVRTSPCCGPTIGSE